MVMQGPPRPRGTRRTQRPRPVGRRPSHAILLGCPRCACKGVSRRRRASRHQLGRPRPGNRLGDLMPTLGIAKQRLADQFGSAATAGEGRQNMLCATSPARCSPTRWSAHVGWTRPSACLSRGGTNAPRYGCGRRSASVADQRWCCAGRRCATAAGATPGKLGHAYRIADPGAWTAGLRRGSGYEEPRLEVVQHRLRIADQAPPRPSRTRLSTSRCRSERRWSRSRSTTPGTHGGDPAAVDEPKPLAAPAGGDVGRSASASSRS